ncbi:MAG: hypothetical protein ACRDYW_12665 [Acidimicrobiales bacterium]
MDLRPGTRLRSAVCDTEVVVVRADDPSVDLRCGGHPMLLQKEADAPSGLALVDESGTLLGKRYAHEATGLELLCTKAGAGGLSVGAEAVVLKAAKALPSSD